MDQRPTSPPVGSAPRSATRKAPGRATRQVLEELVQSMTLTEKAAQTAQVELNSIDAEGVAASAIGSVMSGGGGNPGDGSPRAWRDHVDRLIAASRRSRLGIPLLYGTDAVHGHSNVRGATIFPHNIALGAGADPDLVEQIGRASALETAATGPHWTFAPCLAVPQDVRWGRTYEGFGADPRLVAELGAAAIRGWQGSEPGATGVAACAKHFVGEGSMVWGTAGTKRHPWISYWDPWGPGWQIDQGDIQLDERELRELHLPPFRAAVDAGVRTVMACYGSWRGSPIHGHRRLLTEILKEELGFDGFVVSDWMGVDQVEADLASATCRVLEAGVDMIMIPFDYRRYIDTVVELVETGRLSPERLDDAVLRILSVKGELGLIPVSSLDEGAVDGRPGGQQDRPPLSVIGCDDHRALARRAVGAGAVVLIDRVDQPVVPIPATASILAAGQAIDDIGISCGGWTITWQGSPGPITDGRTVLDGLRRVFGANRVHHQPSQRELTADYGVVTVHELPYVEGAGDRADLRLDDDQVELVRQIRTRVEHLVVLVVSGRPLLIEPVVELADAVVACWLPGSEADGIAEVLNGTPTASGRLPVPWPRHPSQVPAVPAPTAPGLGPALDPASSPSSSSASVPPAWPVGHRHVPNRKAE